MTAWPSELTALVERADRLERWTSVDTNALAALDQQACALRDRLADLDVEVTNPEAVRVLLVALLLVTEGVVDRRCRHHCTTAVVNGITVGLLDHLPIEARP